MEDAENLAKLLRCLRPAVFRDFIAHPFQVDLPLLEARQSAKAQREVLAIALTALDMLHRRELEDAAERIISLTDGPGQDVVAGLCEGVFDAAQQQNFEQCTDQYERALWLYLHAPALFKEALDARQADVFRQSVQCYTGFLAPKNLTITRDAAALDIFHERIAQQTGCAKDMVAVQIFKRLRADASTGEEISLYQISLHYNCPPESMDRVQAGTLIAQQVIRARSSFLTYDPEQGYLEVLSKDPTIREVLACITADTLFQTPFSGEKIPLKQYDYQSLAALRTFDLTGEESVASAIVTELGYTQANRTLQVKIWLNDAEDLYTAARSLIGPTFDFRHHRLTYAKLAIRLKKTAQARARTIVVILREDNKSNIKTKREADRLLCNRLLMKWGLIKEICDVAPDALAA